MPLKNGEETHFWTEIDETTGLIIGKWKMKEKNGSELPLENRRERGSSIYI